MDVAQRRRRCSPEFPWSGIIVCVAGPSVRRDELVCGATLLDVAPTIPALFSFVYAEICSWTFGILFMFSKGDCP